MLLSSGVIWRHHTLEDFRAECPGGDADLQALIVEQLDERLDWLESLGAHCHRPRDGESAHDRQAASRSTTSLPRCCGAPATSGSVTPLEELRWMSRSCSPPAGSARRSRGGCRSRCGRARGARETDSPSRAQRGAATSAGWTSSTGAALPATPARACRRGDWVRLGQVYGRHALVLDETGAAIESADRAWHENDLVQEIARRPGGSRVVPRCRGDAGSRRWRHDRRRADRGRAGGRRDGRRPRRACRSRCRPATDCRARHGLCHAHDRRLAVDRVARVLGDGTPIDGLYAAGVDVGGVATGGYSSGLAAALVLGCVAAESIAEASS